MAVRKLAFMCAPVSHLSTDGLRQLAGTAKNAFMGPRMIVLSPHSLKGYTEVPVPKPDAATPEDWLSALGGLNTTPLGLKVYSNMFKGDCWDKWVAEHEAVAKQAAKVEEILREEVGMAIVDHGWCNGFRRMSTSTLANGKG